MANALFAAGKEGLLGADVDYDADTIRALFVDHADDTPVPATDDFLDDIATAARVPSGTDASQTAHTALASKTKTGGVADAANTSFTALTGDVVESIVIYKSTATDTTSRLIVYIDTATGLALTPNGGDVTIAWDDGASKIFAL